MNNDTKISPNAILALKEALAVIYWKKEDLRDYLKLVLSNNAIIATLDWNGTKREAVKELVERMINRPDIYRNDLIQLFFAVTDFEDFSNLKFWDDDGTKTKKAKEAVNRVRTLTKGHIQKSKEEEEASKRRIEYEKKIAQRKNLSEELLLLKETFNGLVISKDLQKRGFALEKFLHDIFMLFELDPKGSFKIFGEQIDGSFTFHATDYLLEAKWKRQVDRSDLASFCYKVETKFKTAVGLLITIEGVTTEAISPHFKSIIIMDGVDLVAVLDGHVTLPDLLLKKRRIASETGNIYLNYNQF
ncbi:hypothetical protein MTO98_09540 [Mucilaginibacter sp. SMC90]|uniref:hypothetical protein n=1 Tax=Mucilaginibacter sp. SMC90 TaxID=2929803 RepID=UPI001FB49568|nr:hypothetical protein [Mucilaginibacter sp. SMC90]UOE51320.1 hypothetical protein MTO98_09540 [Mucilaginibacter sp. SMC90]